MKIKLVLLVMLGWGMVSALSARADSNGRDTVYIFLPEDEEFPKFYMETEEIFERIKELPRDTIRDTVYVHRFEAFLKERLGEDFELSLLLQDVDDYQGKLDSLKAADSNGYRLFYNFFVDRDEEGQFSPTFVVSDVYLNPGSEHPKVRLRVPDSSLINWQKTVMFSIDDRLQTERFLHDPVLIKRALVAVFNALKQQRDPQRLLLFLPEYNYMHKREFIQFVKSVRMLMDASKSFKFEQDIELDLVLPRPDSNDLAEHQDVLYAATIECSHVGLLPRDFSVCLQERADKKTKCNDVIPLQVLKRDSLTPGFAAQLRSHYYIARFFPGSWDVYEANLDTFTIDSVSPALEADYQENYWELYFFILVALFFIFGVLGVLYYVNLSFSMFVNNNMESVLLVGIVLLLEIMALVINIFQYMCVEDTFTLFAKNPVLIFSFPLVVVVMVPVLRVLAKKRRIPH